MGHWMLSQHGSKPGAVANLFFPHWFFPHGIKPSDQFAFSFPSYSWAPETACICAWHWLGCSHRQ